MTPLQKPFKEKCVSAAEALKVVQSMNRVVIGHAAGEPKVLVEELMRQSVRLVGVEVMHMLPLYSCEYAKPEHSRSFRHNALFAGAASREAINS
jgi:4-hydroxybutyrate CoA-transferase